MRRIATSAVATLLLMVVLSSVPAMAQLVKGAQAPSIKAYDIQGQLVDLDQIIKQGPDLVIMFFFTISTGEEMALKLSAIDMRYGRDKLKIIALGFKEEEEALKKFAAGLDIHYYIIDTSKMSQEEWIRQIESLPLTLFVIPQEDRRIERVLRGGSSAEAALVREIAENLFQQRKLAMAQDLADESVKAGEDQKQASELKGYILAQQGKLPEAEIAFTAADSKEGLAKVALDRGEYDKAIELANQAGPNSGYADTLKGTAQMRSGKLDEAAATLDAAEKKAAKDWQKAETVTAHGRVKQEKGDVDGAIARFENAVALDPYHVEAVTNEAVAYRTKGDLETAAKKLEKVQSVRQDDLSSIMLEQIRKEMKDANDVKRGELIRAQINDLKKRFDELKAAGKDKPVDPWSTRPLILAFLPSENAAPVFFERAGTDVAVRREIESRLQSDGRVKVVEREVLDKLLQELQLSSSELVNPNTQLQLGKVLSAKLLGFIDFAQMGPDTVMYLRLIDTETTEVAMRTSKSFKDSPALSVLINEAVQEILNKSVDPSQLKGLVADAPSDDAVMINLGSVHGVKTGQQFYVVEEKPVEAGGKVVTKQISKLGTLEVTQVQDTYSICKVVSKSEGVKLAKEMKVKAAGGK